MFKGEKPKTKNFYNKVDKAIRRHIYEKDTLGGVSFSKELCLLEASNKL